MSRSRIIYYINVEDVQNVALEKLERKLNSRELKKIKEKLGDYIHWYDAIDAAIDAILDESSGWVKLGT